VGMVYRVSAGDDVGLRRAAVRLGGSVFAELRRDRWETAATGGLATGTVTPRLADDAAFGGGEEVEEVLDFGGLGGGIFGEGEDLGGEVAFFFEEEGLVGGLEGADGLGGEAAALEADEVESAQGGGVAVGDHEGGDVLDDFAAAADDGVGTDAAELVDAGEAGDDDVVCDGDVAAEGGAVGEDAVVADDGVVGDVGVGKEVVVVADDGGFGSGATVDGDVFAEGVAVANEDAGWFAGVFEILRALADGGERVELVVGADGGVAIDDDVAVQVAAVAEGDVVVDDAVGADGDIGTNDGLWRDDRGGMDHGERS